jgi:hypothetical protein
MAAEQSLGAKPQHRCIHRRDVARPHGPHPTLPRKRGRGFNSALSRLLLLLRRLPRKAGEEYLF